MLSLLSRIPIKSQQPLAIGLLGGALLATLIGLLFVLPQDATREECTGRLFFKECVTKEIPFSTRATYLLIGVALIALALACVLAALKLVTMQGQFKRYEAILAGSESMPVHRIASITNANPSKVRNAIQSMIDSGMISDFYIDYNADCVVSTKYIPKTSRKTVVKCSECGGNNDLIVGITKPCSFCGQPLLLGTS